MRNGCAFFIECWTCFIMEEVEIMFEQRELEERTRKTRNLEKLSQKCLSQLTRSVLQFFLWNIIMKLKAVDARNIIRRDRNPLTGSFKLKHVWNDTDDNHRIFMKSKWRSLRYFMFLEWENLCFTLINAYLANHWWFIGLLVKPEIHSDLFQLKISFKLTHEETHVDSHTYKNHQKSKLFSVDSWWLTWQHWNICWGVENEPLNKHLFS